MTNQEILIATKNIGKVRELEQLLTNLPITLRSLNDFPNVVEPEETGLTFDDNAELKARYYALQTGLWSLADDSGIEVDALNGAPGVYSARYAGENATNEERIDKLLNEIQQADNDNRTARFVCSMAVADEKGEIRHLTEGVCNGKIAFMPRGEKGFGYDPIFVPDGFDKTFGELSNQIKQEISHRARASAKIIQYLRGFIAG